MASYRGTDKYDLADSIQAAKKFIDALQIGPATKKWFSGWVEGSPLREIRGARDNDELVLAMRRTAARSAFQPFSEVFAFHGTVELSEDSEGGEGTAAQIYADLAHWGAFQNVPSPRPLLDEVKKEIDDYLIIEGFRRLARDADARRAMTADGTDPVDGMVQSYLSKLKQHKNNAALADWLDSMIPIIALMQGPETQRNRETETAIKTLIEDAPANGRFFLRDMVSRLNGLHGYRGNVMDVPRPIHLYGVEPYVDTTKDSDVMEALHERVDELIEPYNRLDEAWMKPADFIDSRAKGKPTVYFIGTARTAQAVANKMLYGKVIRYEGSEPYPEIKRQQPGRGGPAPGGPS